MLLRGESTLSRGEREIIATHVSWRNDCFFVAQFAAAQLGHDEVLVQKVWLRCVVELYIFGQRKAHLCGNTTQPVEIA